MSERSDQLRTQILELVDEYSREAFPPRSFIPGETPVPVSGRVYDSEDIQSLVDSSLDFWLTTGRFAHQFEREFARFFRMRHAILVNSGSSANLLALTCLTSPLLKDRQLKPGDEVITVASGFPTTVNPIFQNNLVPVFVESIELLADPIGKPELSIVPARLLAEQDAVHQLPDRSRLRHGRSP